MNPDQMKGAVDVASVSTAMAALIGWLPPIAALASLVWTLIQIVEWSRKKKRK
jgi:hypothetical protein